MRSVPGLGRDVLAVVLLIALAMGVGGYLLANVRVNWPWENSFLFTAEFSSVPAIAPGKGQEVRIAGVTVGDIRDAQPTDHGTAMLTLAIKTDDRIFDNARIVLRPKSPLNEMYVTIAPGGPPGRPLAEGGTIPVAQTEQPVPVDEVFSHLDDHTRAGMTSMLAESDVALANAPRTLPPGLRAIDHTLVGLRPVVEKLQVRADRVRTLSTALSEIATALGGNDVRLASIADSLQSTLGVVARNDDSLAEALRQLPGATSDLRRASAGVDTLGGQLDPTLDDLRAAAPDLPDTLSKLRDTVDQVHSTLKDTGPFLDKARPAVGDLRPFVADLNKSLDDLEPVADRLDPITSGVIPYLPDLKAFMAQTASSTSLRDANGGFFRARVTVAPETVPFLPKSLQRPPKEPSR
jgi:phospholipid/cholesterol/gamma-HCH transport system substrate-binding protein